MNVYLSTRTVEEGDCLVWNLSCVNGHPSMRWQGKNMLVRRVLWQETHGDIPKNKVVRCTCGESKCVNIEHMALMTYAQIGKIEGARGKMSDHARSAKIAATKRKLTGLTIEQVREIRASPMSGVALAAQLGFSQNKISKIRLHKCWREFHGNPFSGLGAR